MTDILDSMTIGHWCNSKIHSNPVDELTHSEVSTCKYPVDSNKTHVNALQMIYIKTRGNETTP